MRICDQIVRVHDKAVLLLMTVLVPVGRGSLYLFSVDLENCLIVPLKKGVPGEKNQGSTRDDAVHFIFAAIETKLHAMRRGQGRVVNGARILHTSGTTTRHVGSNMRLKSVVSGLGNYLASSPLTRADDHS